MRMKRIGRPPLPPEMKRAAVRVVFYASHAELEAMRQYAAYEDHTIQEITRRCWRKVLQHAEQHGILELHGATKST